MTPEDLLDPLIGPGFKGFPHDAPAVRRSAIAARGWNVLAGDLPLPIALLKRSAGDHHVAWLQGQARRWGIDLAPHGKTTMSPQLFARQLAAGAWGITFATVNQLAVGVAAGVRNALIANQVLGDRDLAAIQSLRCEHAGLRVVFLVDSPAQLALIEAWAARHAGDPPFEVLLELGLPAGRTGCRTHEEAVALAERLHASPAVRLVGIECYEGLGAKGDATDLPYAAALMDRVDAIACHCHDNGLFDSDEVLLSAGGSAIFDLVATRLTTTAATSATSTPSRRASAAHRARAFGRRSKSGPTCSRAPSRASRSSRSAGAISRSTSSCRCRSRVRRAAR
jgi:D-serine dehydratase